MSLTITFAPPYPTPVDPPTQADWQTNFVYGSMGISTSVLPTDSPSLGYAYNVAVAVVNMALTAVGGPIYKLAVYNLAADNLVNFAPDLPGAATVPGLDPPQLYFATLRAKLNIGGFAAGVVASSSDNSTSESLEVLDVLKNLSIGQLQNLKTSWGRTYLTFAQAGSSSWGLS